MIGAGMRAGLRQEGYVVDWVQDGLRRGGARAEDAYGLVLLDLGLPRKDGFALLEGLRRRGNARAGADHHGARRGGRPRARPRPGRRRLPGEAVRSRRARGARARGAAPSGRARASRGSSTAASCSTLAPPRRSIAGARSRFRRASSRCCTRCSTHPGGAFARAARGAALRLGRGERHQLRSRCTSTICARSSASDTIRTRARRRLRPSKARPQCRSAAGSSSRCSPRSPSPARGERRHVVCGAREADRLFDYQLQQMALSLHDQMPQLPTGFFPHLGHDFVVQLWDPAARASTGRAAAWRCRRPRPATKR